MIVRTADDVRHLFEGVVELHGNDVRVVDADRLRTHTVGPLLHNALSHPDARARWLFQWMLREAAAAEVVQPAPSSGLHEAMLRRPGLAPMRLLVAMPRTLAHETALACFEAAREEAVGPVAFGLKAADLTATWRPAGFATSVLAAALAEGHQGPVFLFLEDIAPDRARWEANRDDEIDRWDDLIGEAFDAGFENFGIDVGGFHETASPAADDPQSRQAKACRVAAELIARIRARQPEGVDADVGVVVRAPRGADAADEARAFLDGLQGAIAEIAGGARGPSRIAVHREGAPGFDPALLRDVGEVARREFGMAGSMQVDTPAFSEADLAAVPTPSTCDVQVGALLDRAAREDGGRLAARVAGWYRALGLDNTSGIVGHEVVALRKARMPAPISGRTHDAENTLRSLFPEPELRPLGPGE